MTELREETRLAGEVGALSASGGGGQSGKDSWARDRWHALGASRFPPWTRFNRDFSRLIREWIVAGQVEGPGTLTKDDSVITLGSCFARELRAHLERVGSTAKNFWIPSGLDNTFAILDFVSWCVTGEETGRGYRYDRTAQGEIGEWEPEAERERYLAGIRDAAAFVFTLGLAEVWEDRETGGVFWRGVPKDVFDPDRHVFRVSTVEENEENVLRIVELVRSVNPTAPIVLTLSPVPLAATFRDVSCITADCVSKSTLRVALDRVLERGLDGVRYWPSFEMVRWAVPHLPWRAYTSGRRAGDADSRHVTRYLVAEIIDAFVEAYYAPVDAAELRARAPAEHAPHSVVGRLEGAFPRLYRRSAHADRPEEEELRRPIGALRASRTVSPFAKSHWHALGAKPFPPRAAFDAEVSGLIRDWVVPGHAPSEPLLERDDSVIALGSCFAQELRSYLGRVGFRAANFWIPAGLNNTFAIRDFVSWCVTGRETESGFRYDTTDEGEIREWAPEAEREKYLQGLREAGAFVFTLGLAEVWQDRATGGVFWRGVPESIFDAGRHVFRLSTIEENEENVLRIVELIRSVNPTAPIVLTLSPVPLAATFRDVSCITADCVSKSTLRVTLDRVLARGLDGVHYWPSYEIVRWAGAHYPWRAYGIDDRNPRHVTRYLVAEIIDAFVAAFYTPRTVAALTRRRSRDERFPRSPTGRFHAAGYPLRKNRRKKARMLASSLRMARHRLVRRLRGLASGRRG